jgi:hypothetical protein
MVVAHAFVALLSGGGRPGLHGFRKDMTSFSIAKRQAET